MTQVVVRPGPRVVKVIEDPDDVVAVPAPGPQGPRGPIGPAGGVAYVHTQTTPSASWVIQHNLERYPGITVVVDGEVVLADVYYIDINNINVVLAQPASGLAILP